VQELVAEARHNSLGKMFHFLVTVASMGAMDIPAQLFDGDMYSATPVSDLLRPFVCRPAPHSTMFSIFNNKLEAQPEPSSYILTSLALLRCRRAGCSRTA